MSGIGGKVRTGGEFTLKVGVGEVEVVAVNPDREELNALLGRELEKDPEYLGEKEVEGLTSKVKTLRLSIYVKNKQDGKVDQITFFLEDRERLNKDGNKTQYINSVGTTTWAASEADLPDWFTKRDYRIAKVGEGDFYEFLQAWLSKLDYRDAETTLALDWKKLMANNMKEIREQIDGAYCDSIVVAYTVRNVQVTDKDTDEVSTKQYQAISTKGFIPGYNYKFFKTRKFTTEILDILREKKPKELKAYEKFAVKVTDKEYGIKDHFVLEPVRDYDPSLDFAASEAVISDDGDDY